ncbi:kinase [Phenylobacterium sp.]|uniref:kinase n=1 Tax=Phenylobacterium sp. TaxID=1871053 RepID=UPI0039C9BA76
MAPRPVVKAWLAAFRSAEALPEQFDEMVERLHRPLVERIAAEARAAGRCWIVGVCGTQASGKSTLCAVVARLLEEEGLRAAVISIDDLYLTREEREALAREVHPLLITRGVPGTHDVDLGLRLFDELARAGSVRLPRFEKARDTRRPTQDWDSYEAPADVVLFEGWCVGARPQDEAALAQPVNALERDEDPDGAWRAYANTQLAGPYQALFGRLDRLVMLQAPGFETVLDWRREQEAKLRARLAAQGGDLSRTMDEAALVRFIAHYERLTRHILSEMPARADVLARLGPARELLNLRI